MDMSTNMMKKHFDFLVGNFSEKMEDYNTLQDKLVSRDYLAMSPEDASSLASSYDKVCADLFSDLRIFAKFILEHKDCIKFE